MNIKLSTNDYTSYPYLSSGEAKARLESKGYNELPSSKRRKLLEIAFEVFKEPMFVLLIACGIIYIFLGDLREASLLIGSIFVIMTITFYQERKTERALEALKDLSSPRAKVLRDGKVTVVPGREVVEGDIIIVSEGDRVPADAVLLDVTNLMANESLLTGEPVPVRKIKWDGMLENMRPGGDDIPFIYSGTLITQGQGVARVKFIGTETEMGKIGKSLEEQRPEKTLLQKEVKVFVKQFAILGAALCFLVILSYGIIVGGWLDGFLSGIALAMSLLPEEFPVILTVFLALGAWRMSKHRVLTRKVPVIETLGAATVLCVDKTGTLTENKMTVVSLFADGEEYVLGNEKELPERFHKIMEFAVLASHKDPFDPMEKAIRHTGSKHLFNTEHWHQSWQLEQEYPLSQHLLAMSNVWISPEKDEFVIAAKGAPEAILDLCHLSKPESLKQLEVVEKMAQKGLRLLGVAKTVFKKKTLPENVHDIDFEFIGFVGLTDPVREQVPEAIKECYRAGIRTIMITGDYPGTAKKIAGEIGLTTGEIITGPELEEMSDETLAQKIANVNIFARVVPEQKLRIVKALRALGEVVAMTGDGVNDAPALKAAHIGIAMGQRGTDVAREAADLVLLNDDFNSIVEAVRQGRRIYANIKKAMAYVFAIHIPIAGMTLLPILFRWPSVLLPVHIVFLELIIDPACSIVFEAQAAEDGIMDRPPRNLKKRMFSKETVLISVVQGFSILLISLAVYGIFRKILPDGEARALAFITIIVGNISLIMADMSWSENIVKTLKKKNIPLWIMLVGVVILLGVVIYEPTVRDIFKFSTPNVSYIVLAVAAGLFSILGFEILRIFRRRSSKSI
jgi:P-type Ca2+ transporter type 2C